MLVADRVGMSPDRACLPARLQPLAAQDDTLRDLERDGLVERHVYDQTPSRVKYELTALGPMLHEPLLALSRWAEAHNAAVLVAPETDDARS